MIIIILSHLTLLFFTEFCIFALVERERRRKFAPHLTELFNGKERKQSSSNSGMYRTQNFGYARHKPLCYYEEQKKHSRQSGIEEIQFYSEENDRTQRNQVKA